MLRIFICIMSTIETHVCGGIRISVCIFTCIRISVCIFTCLTATTALHVIAGAHLSNMLILYYMHTCNHSHTHTQIDIVILKNDLDLSRGHVAYARSKMHVFNPSYTRRHRHSQERPGSLNHAARWHILSRQRKSRQFRDVSVCRGLYYTCTHVCLCVCMKVPVQKQYALA